MRLKRVILLATIFAPLHLKAATLKPYSTLIGGTVRLSDIWEGVTHDMDLGPAPAPGGRITVPASQLAAIAHQFNVDWQPNSSADQIIIDRPGRSLTRDDLLPAIRTALTDAGVSLQSDIELSAFTAPLFEQSQKLDIVVAQFDYDKLSGRFSALTDITTQTASPMRVRVTGRALEMVDVPVLRRRVLPGDVVTTADIAWAHIPRVAAGGNIIQSPDDAIGLSARRSIQPNLPIKTADLGEPVLVQKGNEMLISLEIPGMSLSARGTALDAGGRGDRIRVLNEYNRTVVDAIITSPGQARVIPGTARPVNSQLANR